MLNLNVTRGGQANFFLKSANRKSASLSSFCYRNSVNYLGVPICKSQILKFSRLIRKSAFFYKILHNSKTVLRVVFKTIFYFAKFWLEHYLNTICVKVRICELAEVVCPQKSSSRQIANPQVTNHKEDWILKSQICKVPHLQKVRNSNKLFKSPSMRICYFHNFFADRPPLNVSLQIDTVHCTVRLRVFLNWTYPKQISSTKVLTWCSSISGFSAYEFQSFWSLKKSSLRFINAIGRSRIDDWRLKRAVISYLQIIQISSVYCVWTKYSCCWLLLTAHSTVIQ